MFWIGVLPALLVLWIRRNVEESPVWLERQRQMKTAKRQDEMSLIRIFRGDLVWTTVQTSLLVGSFMFSYYAITFWYATFLREEGRSTLPFLVAFNIGAVAGAAAVGRLSESRAGRRGAATIAALASLAVVPIYLFSTNMSVLIVGAFLMGFFGAGAWGVVPTYLSERFPTVARGVGSGFSYHAGAALGALTPLVVGALQDAGWILRDAMAVCIVTALIILTVMLWLGPETRGREFQAMEDQ
jgi:SHS family lactate transporter-like MFS transporter